jgi:hypothetical protein
MLLYGRLHSVYKSSQQDHCLGKGQANRVPTIKVYEIFDSIERHYPAVYVLALL